MAASIKKDSSLLTKLFVTNIPASIEKEHFVSLIDPYAKNGKITEIKFFKRVVSSTSYAFIHFESAADGELCMNDLDRRILKNHTIRVGPASSKNPLLSSTNLYIEGVPKEWNDTNLRNHFEKFGKIEAARVLIDKASNTSREVGFVHYTKHEDALSVLLYVHPCSTLFIDYVFLSKAMQNCQNEKANEDAPRCFKIKFANKGRKNVDGNSDVAAKKITNSEMNKPRFEEQCRYFQRGGCKRGKDCFYRHSLSSVQSENPSALRVPVALPIAYNPYCYSVYPQYAQYNVYAQQYALSAYPQMNVNHNTQNLSAQTVAAPNMSAVSVNQPEIASYAASRQKISSTTAQHRWDPTKAHPPPATKQ